MGTPPSPLTVGLPLPGGARLRVEPDPPSSSGATAAPARRTIALRFDSPALGRIDFLLDVDPAAASATVEVAAGAAPLARSAANDLRTALSTVTARPSAVTIRAREETLDVRA